MIPYPGFPRTPCAQAHWRGSLRDERARHGGLVLRRSPPASPVISYRVTVALTLSPSEISCRPGSPRTPLSPAPLFPGSARGPFLRVCRPTHVRGRLSIAPCRITSVTCHHMSRRDPAVPSLLTVVSRLVLNSETPSLQGQRRALCLTSGDSFWALARNSGLIYEVPTSPRALS